MGMNTVIMLLNDAWHEMKKNPKKFVDDIEAKMHMPEPTIGSKFVHFGNEVQVDSPIHSSQDQMYMAGGNWLMPLDEHEIERLIARGQYDLIEKQLKLAQRKITSMKKHYKQRLEQVDPLLFKAKKALKS